MNGFLFRAPPNASTQRHSRSEQLRRNGLHAPRLLIKAHSRAETGGGRERGDEKVVFPHLAASGVVTWRHLASSRRQIFNSSQLKNCHVSERSGDGIRGLRESPTPSSTPSPSFLDSLNYFANDSPFASASPFHSLLRFRRICFPNVGMPTLC